ncbi:MAG: menaquinone biosynthesis protein [Acidipila sp.]|nr:menaquinone biosynthesis protein [Acidipila sp.]
MDRLRISVVEYLNTAPLVWSFKHGPLAGKYDLSFTVPSQCAEDLRLGRADIAIIPAIECQRIPDLDVIPDVAIASKGAVRSILLVSKVSIKQARHVALDSSSRSSAALVRLLCQGYWGIHPEFVEAQPDVAAMLAHADAALVIGDPALRLQLRHEAGQPAFPGAEKLGADKLFIYDVAEQWRQWTGRPAVLALWAARHGCATSEVVADFLAAKQYGLKRIREIAVNTAIQLDLPAASLASYLRHNIDFSLDAANLAGLKLFYEKAAQAGLIHAASPLRFAHHHARVQVES